jgi:hypothetical protein
MPENIFEITFGKTSMIVEQLALKDYWAFRVVFSSTRKPLILSKQENAAGELFWTSIPEGRQKEAEGMGKLIDEYLKSKE